MTSSKFARSKHSFRVPSICKDKMRFAAEAPPPPPGPPLPGLLLKNEYVFHGTAYGYNYDYEATIQMPKTLPEKWNSEWPVPDDDVYSEFFFYPHNWKYFSVFWINPLVGPTINFISPVYQWVENGEFDTGVIPYTRSVWSGTATGRITNVV